MSKDDIIKNSAVLEKEKDSMMALWIKHKGLIYKAVNRFAGRGISYDDLLQEAYLPFYKAVKTYSNNTGFEFSTILTHLIEWYFIRYFNSTANYTKLELTTLNEVIGQAEQGDTERIDQIQDQAADCEGEALKGLASTEVLAAYKEAERKLPKNLHRVAELYFLRGSPPKIIAIATGDTIEETKAKLKKALKLFKQDYHLREKLHRIQGLSGDYYKNISLHFFKHTGLSSVEWQILKKERLGAI